MNKYQKTILEIVLSLTNISIEVEVKKTNAVCLIIL